MERVYWKPANLLNPVPPVLVCSMDSEGRPNVMTAAWTGTVCSDPVMVSVSIRPERLSYGLIRDSGEFVLSLPTRRMTRAVDFCGVRSGRDVDKFQELGLTQAPSRTIRTPGIAQCPVNLECRLIEIRPLGTHDLFLGEVTGVNIDPALLDAGGRLDLGRADLLAYVHGEYYTLGEKVGKFGFSVQKRPTLKGARPGKARNKGKNRPS